MIKTLIMINMFTSSIFLFMNHPLSMGMILMIQTIIISLMSGTLNSDLWFSYMLFLIMVGGMLILFMYMTSIASNEKFKPLNPLIMITTMIMIMPTMFSDLLFNNITSTNEVMKFTMNKDINSSMNKYFSSPTSIMFLFIMMYLFLTLIATVKISNIKKGPLRQMN